MTETAALLTCRDLNCYYGLSHIVCGFDLDVGPGEFVALIGRNGMGKTTILKGIVGLVRRRVKTLVLNGRGIERLPTREVACAGLQLVPEGRGIFVNLTVEEQIVMCAKMNRSDSKGFSIDEVLELFPRLSERRDHYGDQLSGGEQQMLTIARALLRHPSCILIDEATEGLAPIVSVAIWEALDRIRSAGVSLVVVDKSLSDLVGIADRFVIIERGRKVFDGSTQSFKQRRSELDEFLAL